MRYRFPKEKDTPFSSYKRQKRRYEIIKPYLGQNSVGAEFGVYKGGFGEFLLPHCQKLYLVDPWYRAGPYWKTAGAVSSRVDAVRDILQVYKDDIHKGTVEVVVDFSYNFLSTIKTPTFDFIYVDSCHTYESTVRELSLSLPTIKPGGYLMGDDYDPDPASKQYGVYRAVQEFVSCNPVKLVLVSSRQWVVRLA